MLATNSSHRIVADLKGYGTQHSFRTGNLTPAHGGLVQYG